MDDPSRLFVYDNARLLPELIAGNFSATSRSPSQPPQLTNSGSQNRDAFERLNLHRVCDEKSWRFHLLRQGQRSETVEHLSTALSHRRCIRGSQRIESCRVLPLGFRSSRRGQTHLSLGEMKAVGIVTLIQLKQCLSEGYPVIFGLWYYWKQPPWLDTTTRYGSSLNCLKICNTKDYLIEGSGRIRCWS